MATQTFKGILNINPYNDDPIVEKKECVGHVKKRMGSRLRKAKKDNKGIGGKGTGKLTDKIIDELSIYYGLAIHRNPDSIEDMKRDIWATYFHKSSTDKNPQHMNCPPGPSSWCKWQKVVAEDTLDDFDHENPPLTEEVLKVIKPIYESLFTEFLLQRCLGSETQNNNESLNSLIWTFAPKHIHAGVQTMEIANYIAVCIFNEGFISILKIMTIMGITIGPDVHAFAVKRDETRIERSEFQASDDSKEAITARLAERTSENVQLKWKKVEFRPFLLHCMEQEWPIKKIKQITRAVEIAAVDISTCDETSFQKLNDSTEVESKRARNVPTRYKEICRSKLDLIL